MCLWSVYCFNPSGAGLWVVPHLPLPPPVFLLFPLMQSSGWCTNLQRLCASLLTSSFPFSFPFAVVCPEKEVKFQRAPNGEPCLPTHLPTSCCLCPPASHADPFCHVRVRHSSSLHVCAVWAGVACPARRGPLPKSPNGLKNGHWKVWYGTPCCGSWAAPFSLLQGVKLVGILGKGSKHRQRPSLRI